MFNLRLTLEEYGDSVIRVHMLDIDTDRVSGSTYWNIICEIMKELKQLLIIRLQIIKLKMATVH